MDKIKVTDYEAVLAAVAKYTEACKEGKSDIMKPAFTDNALMYGYLNGEYYHGSEGTAATVRVTLEDWHGLAFTDFHSLIKEDGQWKILAKVFHQYQ